MHKEDRGGEELRRSGSKDFVEKDEEKEIDEEEKKVD